MNHIQLNDNVQMPMVGFGTYLIPNEETAAAVKAAIGAGYRHIDTAEGYQNEEGVGTAINACMRDSGIARDELFVTTKLWPGNPNWGETTKNFDETIASCEESLRRLQLDYIDLYLIHAPFHLENRLEQWRALIELQKQGKVRAIGVSNFTREQVADFAAADLPLPSVNQVELHPWSQKPELVQYLKENGVVPMAYSSLVPLSTWRVVPGQDSAKTEAMQRDSSDAESPFKRMAAKYGVSESQLLLHWGVQNGFPVIPKSTHAERMQQNLDIFSFEIDAEDMAEIATMNRDQSVAWAVGDPSQLV